MQKPDVSLLVPWTYSHAWSRLDESVAEPLKTLPCVCARIENSIKFTWFSDSSDATLHVSPEAAPRLREGFLRAALAELVSVEEVLPLDLANGPHAGRRLRMNDLPLPHVHLVRELRNHELHLHHNSLSGFTSELLWGHIDRLQEATPITVSRWILEGVTAASFSRLNNAKFYSAREIALIIDWFNETQRQWGVHEVLLRAANDYASALCREFVPRAT
jgi:hypothetical protein